MPDKSLIELNIGSAIGSPQKTVVGKLVRDSEEDKVYKPDNHREISSIRILPDRTDVLMKNGEKKNAHIKSEKKLICPFEIFVYGRSDDLVIVDGSVSGEFMHNLDGPTTIKLNDTEVSVTYDGEWDLNVVEGNTVSVAEKYNTESTVSEMFCEYSATARLGFASKPTIEKL